jgi:cbb3-type cytochrome oxidase maturation protein
MNGMALIIASAFAIGLCALVLLIWALNSGQYDDPDGDAARILIDGDETDETVMAMNPPAGDLRA